MAEQEEKPAAAVPDHRHDQHQGPDRLLPAFKGLAEKVYCVPIRGSDAMIDPVILANAAYDAGLIAEPMSTVGECAGSHQGNRLRTAAPATHPDRRIALSGRRCACRQRHTPQMKKARSMPGFFLVSDR
jgi:hypothetical protein